MGFGLTKTQQEREGRWEWKKTASELNVLKLKMVHEN
jgi:hypothetical protein